MNNTERKDVFIKTFDGFDLYVDGRLVYFRSGKAKEMLAILVEKKGSSVSLAQIAYMLYEDTQESLARNNIRVVYHRLRRILEESGCEDILIHRRGSFAVNTEMFRCDLYEMMKGNEKYIRLYAGNYMGEYPWATDMKPYLNLLYKNYHSSITVGGIKPDDQNGGND